MNHFPDRLKVFQEWRRVLRPGRRAVFTDPVVITGPVTNDELALRSSIGLFLFVPPGVNEQLIEASGFRLLKHEDVSANAALVSGRWHESRQRHKDALIKIEGEERFEGLQQFFAAVHRLTSERRLSRIVYLVEKQVVRRFLRPKFANPAQRLQKNLHVLKVKGDRVGLEKLVADHAREVEAEHVFPRKRPIINTLDVFFLYVAQGNLMHGVRARSSASRRRRHLQQLCFPPA